MIVSFDPAARSLAIEQGPMPPDSSDWMLSEGQPVRVWLPDLDAPGPAWFLHRMPLPGLGWIEIPDGLGMARGLDLVARMIRLPAPGDEAAALELARPSFMPTGLHGAEHLARSIARRAVRMRGILARARGLDLGRPIPSWLPGPS